MARRLEVRRALKSGTSQVLRVGHKVEATLAVVVAVGTRAVNKVVAIGTRAVNTAGAIGTNERFKYDVQRGGHAMGEG